MYHFLVFDLDGTLAPIGKPASAKTTAMLRAFEKKGLTVCLCSGKPTYYLCGFARQIGLKDPILIGENGGVLHWGLHLPPRDYRVLPFDGKVRDHLEIIRTRIQNALGDRVWFQPNTVAVTPFIAGEEDFDQIEEILGSDTSLLRGLRVYRQCDCFDIMPEEFSKEKGLAYLARLSNAHPSEFIAVGDGVNDRPMLSFSGLGLGIGSSLSDCADAVFDKIEDALEYINELLKGEGT